MFVKTHGDSRMRSILNRLRHRLSFDEFVPPLILLSFIFYSFPGFGTRLVDDAAILFYTGQGLLHGHTPYLDSFIIKGPVASFLVAAGIRTGKLLRLPEIHSARMTFCLFASFSAAATYVLGRDMFRSKWIGFLAFLTFLTYSMYFYYITVGPRTKIPLLLFECLCLLNILHRRWFWAGFFASLSATTWQPMGILCLTGLLFAFFSAADVETGIKSLCRTLVGISLPLLFFVGYFFVNDALKSFLDGFLLIHVSGVNNRGDISLYGFKKLLWHLKANGFLAVAYGFAFVFFLAGRWAKYKGQNSAKGFWKDPYSPLFFTLLALSLWTVVEYIYCYSFPFLPLLSVTFAVLVHGVAEYAGKRLKNWRGLDVKAGLLVLSVAVLILFGCLPAVQKIRAQVRKRLTLSAQKEYFRTIVPDSDPPPRVLCVGKMVGPCVLLGIRPPNRYTFVDSGIDLYMERMEAGGFDGWFDRIRRYDPQIVFFAQAQGKKLDEFKRWLSSDFVNLPDKVKRKKRKRKKRLRGVFIKRSPK